MEYLKEFKTQLTVKDIRKFNFNYNYTKTSTRIVYSIVLAALLVAVIYAFYTKNLGFVETPIMIAIAFMVASPLTIMISSRRMYKKNEFLQKPIKYIISDKAIKAINKDFRSSTKWSKLLKIVETAEHFFIFLDKESALIIPKLHFDMADYKEFLALIKNKVDASKLKLRK